MAMKKIGKNNPKTMQIESDNEVRQRWNQTVDRALVGGIAEEKIMSIKQTEIVDKAKSSIQKQGRQPQLFMAIVQLAIVALQILISQIIKHIYQERDDTEKALPPIISSGETRDIQMIDDKKHRETEQSLPAPPVKPALAEQYPNLNAIYRKLDNQNHAIYLKEQKLAEAKKELENTKGLFKGKRRKELQTDINELVPLVDTMKQQISGIVQDYGYKNVKEFLAKYMTAQAAYGEYQRAVKVWENSIERRENSISVLAKLDSNKQKIRERDNKSKRTLSRSRDRDAR